MAIGPYLLLAGLTAFTAAIRPSAVELALCALTALWMLVMYTLRPAWREQQPVMAVFVVGLIILTGLLVLHDPWFGCFTPAVYVFTFRLLPWPWELPGVAAVAVVAGMAQASDIDRGNAIGLLSYVGVIAANVLPMSAFAWYAWHNQRRNDEIRQANERLSASLAENAELHERLLAQARQAGVHEERQRMAREIHDTLAQGLTGIITQLQAAERSPDWRRHIAAATGLARDSLVEARRSVHALRPEPLRQARLGEALDSVAARWSALHDVPVRVATTGTVLPLSPEAEAALLRTAQEALANIAKHARANRVGLTLSYLDNEVALDVRDDGEGFDLATPKSGFGLESMRQRIEGLAGTFHIESEPGTGTAVSACIPALSG